MQYTAGYSSPLLANLISRSSAQTAHTPVFYQLKNQNDRKDFDHLLAHAVGLTVHDTIANQLVELAQCHQPTLAMMAPTFTQQAIEEILEGCALEVFGVWVYYPWRNQLVHVLPEHHFATVRTNRNKYKITHDEQTVLSTKKIGIMGLSVGHSVALTLALERSFGELRIADFDPIGLSNLNRIRTGIQHIGTPKTVVVAREIAEIDPFLKITLYNEGITSDNLDDFLTKGGKLDLLIDECDSFDIKIKARHQAKTWGIPVLMEGSDRGTIDIERFDLEPKRPVLHGLTEHLDMSKYATLKTFDERVPYITAVTGLETLSHRMKASAVELMSTISTWPQLASAVTFGGGISADLARKILLNTLSISGRFFLDLDEMISDEKPTIEQKNTINRKRITIAEMTATVKNLNLNAQKNGQHLSDEQLLTLIEAAKAAPSGGNNQPWLWHYQAPYLHVFIDETATESYLDPDHISSYLSIGASIENVRLMASTINLNANFIATNSQNQHLGYFSFIEAAVNPNDALLASAIKQRHTNRQITDKKPASTQDLAFLANFAKEAMPSIEVKWATDAQTLNQLGSISAQADLQRLFIKQAYEDFINREMRWTEQEAIQAEDGIGIHTLDLNHNDRSGISLLKDRKMIDFLKEINGGSAFKRLALQQFCSSSAIGLIAIDDINQQTLLQAGSAFERLWLAATQNNWQIHPLNVPLIFFYRNHKKHYKDCPELSEQFTKASNDLKGIFSIGDQKPVFMFRLFKAPDSAKRTIRKSNAKFFSVGNA